MGFSLSGGLSAMGGAIAETAGNAALEMRRAALEREKMELADILASSREERGDARQLANQKELEGVRHQNAIEMAPVTAGANADAQIRVSDTTARNKAKLETELTNNPEWVAGQKRLQEALLSADPRVAAQVRESNTRTLAASLQVKAAQRVEKLQEELAGATDPAARAEISQRIVDLSTDASAIAAERAAARAVYSADVSRLTALNNALEKQTDNLRFAVENGDKETQKTARSSIAKLNGQIDALGELLTESSDAARGVVKPTPLAPGMKLRPGVTYQNASGALFKSNADGTGLVSVSPVESSAAQSAKPGEPLVGGADQRADQRADAAPQLKYKTQDEWEKARTAAVASASREAGNRRDAAVLMRDAAQTFVQNNPQPIDAEIARWRRGLAEADAAARNTPGTEAARIVRRRIARQNYITNNKFPGK